MNNTKLLTEERSAPRGVNTTFNDDTLLTPAEAAEAAHCSVETIRANYRDGSLLSFQPRRHGHVKIPRSALYEWLGRPAARDERDVAPDFTAGGTPDDEVLCQVETGYLPVLQSRLQAFRIYSAALAAGKSIREARDAAGVDWDE